MGYVYLLMSTDSDGLNELYKIGVTKGDVSKRIKALSTGNPNKINQIGLYESKNYLKVEKWLHARYRMQKTEANNEWFYLADDEVSSFNDICKKADETISFMLKNNPFFS